MRVLVFDNVGCTTSARTYPLLVRRVIVRSLDKRASPARATNVLDGAWWWMTSERGARSSAPRFHEHGAVRRPVGKTHGLERHDGRCFGSKPRCSLIGAARARLWQGRSLGSWQPSGCKLPISQRAMKVVPSGAGLRDRKHQRSVLGDRGSSTRRRRGVSTHGRVLFGARVKGRRRSIRRSWS
jgi:hypothetical protein